MSRTTLGVTAAAIAWFSLLIFSFHYLFQTVPEVVNVKPVAPREVSDFEQGSIGGERRAILIEETRRYVAEHPDAPPAMAAGKEFAPEAFINQELKSRHVKWRVRDVHGMTARIYDVS